MDGISEHGLEALAAAGRRAADETGLPEALDDLGRALAEVIGADAIAIRVADDDRMLGVRAVFSRSEALAADVSQITPDGNLSTVMIEWIAPPHFFQGERLLVLYLGDDQAAIDLLTDMLGSQFAGR